VSARRKRRSSYRQCRYCPARLLLVRGLPPLEFTPSPEGNVAVSIITPRSGRFLAKDEEPGRLEKRYRPHECDGMKRAAQRARWRAAKAEHAAGRRAAGRRASRATPSPDQPLPGMMRWTS
jgi:hypothetical protein